jgi:hypothetical protein
VSHSLNLVFHDMNIITNQGANPWVRHKIGRKRRCALQKASFLSSLSATWDQRAAVSSQGRAWARDSSAERTPGWEKNLGSTLVY